MPGLDALPDRAALRIVTADPPLDAESAAALCAALDKLGAQFVREGRASAWASAAVLDGAVLLCAFAADAPLSGCSHDKIAGVLAQHAERGARRLLDAPPIVIQAQGRWRCVDRAGLRALLASGEVGADAPVASVRAETLGAWRAAPTLPLARSHLAALLAR